MFAVVGAARPATPQTVPTTSSSAPSSTSTTVDPSLVPDTSTGTAHVKTERTVREDASDWLQALTGLLVLATIVTGGGVALRRYLLENPHRPRFAANLTASLLIAPDGTQIIRTEVDLNNTGSVTVQPITPRVWASLPEQPPFAGTPLHPVYIAVHRVDQEMLDDPLRKWNWNDDERRVAFVPFRDLGEILPNSPRTYNNLVVVGRPLEPVLAYRVSYQMAIVNMARGVTAIRHGPVSFYRERKVTRRIRRAIEDESKHQNVPTEVVLPDPEVIPPKEVEVLRRRLMDTIWEVTFVPVTVGEFTSGAALPTGTLIGAASGRSAPGSSNPGVLTSVRKRWRQIREA